jgi:serine/threonine protein kinase
MTPEQVQEKIADIGPPLDVWGLGSCLYEMLTGRPPFRGATVLDTLRAVMEATPQPPSRFVRVPRDLEAICMKCLAKESARRYPDGYALADDLRRFLEGASISARPRRPLWDRILFWWR